MKALIDSDTPVFAAAVSSEHEWQALSRLDTTMERIIEMCGCDEYELYVSGKGNFRYEIDPLYKSNRGESPEHREACHNHLIKNWGAIETQGYEADDALGINQDEGTVIVGIDKDLLMIPGKHFQWPIVRGNKTVREAREIEVSEEEGMHTFFTQVLVGDKVDHIIGLHKIGPKKAEIALSECFSEEEMYIKAKEMYIEHGREEDFEKNLDLLWILRSPVITYTTRREMYET